jgi:adenosylhomocysteine nucleosidase
VIVVTGLASEARIADGAGVRTIAGAGNSTALRSALEAALSAATRGILSFGIAGGLDDRLPPATWLVGSAVVAAAHRWPCDLEWTRNLAARLPGSSIVDIAGVDDVVADAAAKRELHSSTGASAVDTESHIVAAVAAANHIPFAVFRVVVDDARSDLPPVATVAIDRDGSINGGAVLRSLARQPSQLPALVRMALNARAAFAALSRGRGLLGAGVACPHLGELLLNLR